MPLPTGPTAIVGPLYPLLMALVFKVFGIYSTGSAVVILALQCLFSSLTCLFIYLCGRDTVGETAGKLAAIVWAVFPLNLLFSVTRIWETSLTGMLAVALFWYMLSVRQSLSISRWATAGALFAIAGLVNTSLIVLAVPFALSAVWTNRTRFIRPLIAAALGGAAFLSPWLIRNYLQFGKPMLRSNFALEFRVGNNELSYGQKVSELHPARSLELNQRWQEVGEKRFMAEESDLNSKFVSAHPRLFAFYTLNRIVNYWTGGWIAPTKEYPNSLSAIAGISGLSLLAFLGVYRMFTGGNSAAPMFAGCFIIYPCVYYITTSQPRFYHSIAPMLILCGAFCLVDLKNKIAISRRAQDHVLPERSAHAVSDTL
ncbi:MAG TPA: glycosyltransferase family 39 protein [Candidatus Dormibacteraeota bacterium]|nr:glycosyltransferase family 39 protein [Candidatus Dormibacteraeota bacterium]